MKKTIMAVVITATGFLHTPQIMADPHVIERELIADYPDPDMEQLPMHHVVPRLIGTPGAIRTPAPRLGEHNRALLAEIGIEGEGFDTLAAAQVVCGEDPVREEEAFRRVGRLG